jgi:hypothetical protein
METQAPTPRQQLVTWWVLWFAFQVGICVMYKFLHRQPPLPSDDSSLWLIATIPALMSTSLRWAVLPRLDDPAKALPVIILGIAFAEATAFLGIFIFPAHHWELFLAAFAGIAQWVPIYAGRFFHANGADGARR